MEKPNQGRLGEENHMCKGGRGDRQGDGELDDHAPTRRLEDPSRVRRKGMEGPRPWLLSSMATPTMVNLEPPHMDPRRVRRKGTEGPRPWQLRPW